MFRHTLHIRLLACLLALIYVGLTMTASQGQARPLPAAQSRGTISPITVLFHQVQRPVAIYVPNSYRPGVAVPLVFALHGGGGDASKMFDPEKRIVEYAESQGFIAVFPNGLPLPTAPADSHNFYWYDPVNIDFMNRLIDLMMNRFTIDSRRVYFIGFSGGAELIYKLVADPAISARIAAVATVAGDMGSKRTDPPTPPCSILSEKTAATALDAARSDRTAASIKVLPLLLRRGLLSFSLIMRSSRMSDSNTPRVVKTIAESANRSNELA